MDYNEFSERFDILYNNITSDQAPGLNAYEKSVFLTKAQDEIIKNYFNPNGNKYGAGYDGNQKRQINFSAITAVYDTDVFGDPVYDHQKGSKSVVWKDDIMMAIHEKAVVERDIQGEKISVNLSVIPLQFAEYDRLMSKPFKRPLSYQAWRLITHDSGNKADLIAGPDDTLVRYSIRYVKKPLPIIVGELDGLKINGYEFGNNVAGNKTQGCMLDDSIHEEILQRAVELAKIAWMGDINSTMQAGQRSE